MANKPYLFKLILRKVQKTSLELCLTRPSNSNTQFNLPVYLLYSVNIRIMKQGIKYLNIPHATLVKKHEEEKSVP